MSYLSLYVIRCLSPNPTLGSLVISSGFKNNDPRTFRSSGVEFDAKGIYNPTRFDITGPEILLMCYMKLTRDNSRWYFYGNLGILDDMKSFNLTHNVCWNKRTLLQKLNFPQVKYYVYKTSCHRKKLPVTQRSFLSKEETSCHNTKPPMTGNYFLLHEEAIKNWYTWLSTMLRKLLWLTCFKNL